MANHIKRREAHKAARKERMSKLFLAEHRFARICPEKVRMVADQVRGMPINSALEVLKFTKKRGGYLLGKVVKSALANAEYQISEQKLDVEIDSLFVADVHVDEGPSMKRWMTRSRGMAYPILRRFCHISATLAASEKGAEGEAKGGERAAEKSGGAGEASAAKKGSKKKAAAAAGAR
jgi:large subunit ribosomal protein L22